MSFRQFQLDYELRLQRPDSRSLAASINNIPEFEKVVQRQPVFFRIGKEAPERPWFHSAKAGETVDGHVVFFQKGADIRYEGLLVHAKQLSRLT